MRRYSFIHLGGERHREGQVSCPKTQRNVPGQGSNPDCSATAPPELLGKRVYLFILSLKRSETVVVVFYFQKAYRHKLYGSHIQWMLPGWYGKDWWRIRDVPGCSAENIRTAAANFLAVEDLVMDTTTNNTLSGLVRREQCIFTDS